MIGSDDPRLTTYAVDEVDAETAAAIEETLRESASARAMVAETKSAAALLADVFAAEEAPTLTAARRQAIAETAARAARAPGLRRLAVWTALAAALVVGWLVAYRKPPHSRDDREARLAVPVAPPSSTPLPTPTPPGAASPAAPRRAGAPTYVRLRGVVKDRTGAVIPGATITAQSLDGGAQVRVTTVEDGTFALKGIRPGRVEVRAELSGFQTLRYTVSAPPGAVLSWKPTLEVGGMAETITVASGGPTVMTSSASKSDQLGQMPVGGRLFNKIQIAPGVVGGVPGGVVGGIVGGMVGTRADDADATGHNTEAYAQRTDNALTEVKVHPLSTFSLDVDTASYSNVRRFLMDMGQRPPADAVRIEELVNYFPYDYAPPRDGERFSADLEIAPAPWKPEHRLLRIGLKTPEIDVAHRPAANLVFLVDVSGSMSMPNKLPLVKQSLRMLVEKLTADDRVAIAVYAGAAGLVLESTPGSQKQTILSAIDRLEAGGSTNGAAGIQLAYEQASQHFVDGGVNRVILATDGDFNVGLTHEGGLARLIQEKAASGVFLSVLGFGMGNVKDSTMELLADKGNGNYAYIDTAKEARKALVEQMAGTLVTVAKDVKIQVEFNPAQVRAYRLIGYENRLLRPEDFKDDTKDAGEVGAGHTVTALYELVPADRPWTGPKVDPLRYQSSGGLTAAARGGELLRLKLRYKQPQDSKSQLQEWTLVDRETELGDTSADFRFAAAVAEFGMLLRDAPDKGQATFAATLELADAARGSDPSGYRAEFLELVKRAAALKARAD